jgi:hypothetical protein
MVNIAVSSVTLAGDIGGAGISRWHWQTPGGTTPVPADCDNALTALYDFYTALAGNLPSIVGWQVQPETLVVDAVSAVPIANVASTVSLATVFGTDNSRYAGGVGARLNMKSSTVYGRRFMRGASMIVPLGGSSYNSDGSVTGGCCTNILTAAAAMQAAFNTAGLEMVIYGRPKKGLVTGGHVGTITAWSCVSTPAGVRSRRS